MSEDGEKRRATVHDVAREAGVSLATVDRVLNARPGVRLSTAQKVEDAIAALEFRRDLSASLLARSRDLHLRFFIPDGANEFMDNLGAAIARRARAAKAERLRIETTRLQALDAEGLAAALDALTQKSCDCAVIVATDDPAVTRAVDGAVRRGVQVLTLVSDLPGSSRRHFIGIDNVAAGRTAASMMGRFCAGGGEIGVIAGSLGLRDHAERLQGFLAVIEAEFPQLEIIGPLEGHDRNAETEALAQRLLGMEHNLVGLYNLGAGNAGLMSALAASGRTSQVSVIVHELTEPTRRGLVSGAIDVVLDQDPDAEIRAAIAAARELAHNGPATLEPGRIEIGIFLRDNLR
ncbi:MAG: LacI family DNA-binding transcriptional regulator [Devosia sp.]|nr:LacI family DNA-binding transcriptional regulator [Devosia sp.]